jgi:hypothetical protein
VLLGGERVMALLEGVQDELSRGRPQIAVYALVVLAAFLVIDALGVLLT